MSHFCVLVIGKDWESQLEPYDENLELPMHQVATREELIERKRREIESYKDGPYARYLEDPEKYLENTTNEVHKKYMKEIFPKMLEWTDEECYQDAIKWCKIAVEDNEGWCEIHEDGSLWKTTNEGAQWDWYQMGGRWRGCLIQKVPDPNAPLYTGWQYEVNGPDYSRYRDLKKEGRCDQTTVGNCANLDTFTPFAVLKDGEWHEKGDMGYWAVVSNEKQDELWEKEVRELTSGLDPDTLLTIVDCHI